MVDEYLFNIMTATVVVFMASAIAMKAATITLRSMGAF